MKKPSPLVLIVLLVSLVSCAKPASRMVNISPGMTKAEVVQFLGDPVSSDLSDNKERLYYSMYEASDFFNPIGYSVLLIDGRVVSFGRDDPDMDF